MDIFKTKDNNKIIPLNVQNYERSTNKEKPYFQKINNEMKYFAICPECENPITIVNLYVDKTIDSKKSQMVMHGRHMKKDVKGITDYDEDSYNECSLSNPESFSSTLKRKETSKTNNEIIQIIKDYPELLFSLIRNISGINISESLFKKMVTNFKASEGYMYKYVTKFNLPYSFINMSNNSSIKYQYIMQNKIGKEIATAINKKSRYFEIKNNQIKPIKLDAEYNDGEIGLYFSNHKISLNDRKSETIELIIKEKFKNKTNDIFMTKVLINKDLFLNLVLKQYRLKSTVTEIFS